MNSTVPFRKARFAPSSTVSRLPEGPEQINLREQAAALVADGKLEEALATLVQASQANPQDQAIQLDAVDVLMQLGRKDEAKQLLAGDYANEPDRANALRARLALLDGAADTAPLEARAGRQPGRSRRPSRTVQGLRCPKPLPRGAGRRAGSRAP